MLRLRAYVADKRLYIVNRAETFVFTVVHLFLFSVVYLFIFYFYFYLIVQTVKPFSKSSLTVQVYVWSDCRILYKSTITKKN